MEPLTIAGIATIVLAGALAKLGENALDGSLKLFSQLLKQKRPDTWNRIAAAGDIQEPPPEIIEAVVTVIEEDQNIKEVAEKVAQENQSKPEAVKFVNNIDQVATLIQAQKIEYLTIQ